MLRSFARRWPWLRPLFPAGLIAAGFASCTNGAGPLVVFLGDSITSGWRLREDEAYPALVARTLGERGRPIRALNAGKSGDTARQGLARLPAVLRLRPAIVVVALGTNDALRDLPLGEAEGALERIVAECHAAGVRVLLVGVRLERSLPPSRASELQGLYARLAAARRVLLVPDLLEGVGDRPELLFPDGLHPNGAGQQEIARRLGPRLELLMAELAR